MEYIGNLKVISTFKTVSFSIEPTKEQADALAFRIVPEIKKHFADEQVQNEFINWKENQNSAQ